MKWIVKVEDATETSPAGMGIAFQYKDDAERRSTELIVEKLMAEELGEALSQKLLGRSREEDGGDGGPGAG